MHFIDVSVIIWRKSSKANIQFCWLTLYYFRILGVKFCGCLYDMAKIEFSKNGQNYDFK